MNRIIASQGIRWPCKKTKKKTNGKFISKMTEKFNAFVAEIREAFRVSDFNYATAVA